MDILCAPSKTTASWREQFGRMLTEAFACGVPVLASNSGEIPYVVGDAGVIFDERHTTLLASELCRLMADAPFRKTLAEKGLERVRRLFTWSTIAADHLAFFEERLAASRN
jgi:glycosyltransferase involved in cell wall biosynthesis